MADTAESRLKQMPNSTMENPHTSGGSAGVARAEGALPSRISSVQLLLLGSLMIVAAILRIIATHDDLWLDELISLRIAHAIKTPWQIFTAIHNDNNQYLNTLYLYFLKKQTYPPVYRYFSAVWGVALVPAGYWLLARRSQAEALILAGLLACSYPLIHLSSEARGYSGAVLGSMLACAALSRWMVREDGSKRHFLLGLTYGLAITFALLSHLTACLIWFALAPGSLIVLARRPERGKWIARWTALNLLPLSVFVALYVFDLRFFRELGGSPMTVTHGLSRLLALGIGWPFKDAMSVWIVLLPLLGLILWRMSEEEKSGEPLSILLSLSYLIPPLCGLMLQPTFFSPRYFLVVLPFLYVGIAILLARLISRSGGPVILAALLALFLAGQARLYVNFLRLGRGQTTAALQYITQHTSSPRITVASSQDFRAGVELAYFAPRVVNKQLLYVQGDNRSSVEPEWYILHQEGSEAPGAEVLNTPGQPTWYRAAYFGASELSGQAWTIYSHQHIP